jgi:hypothetical protein
MSGRESKATTPVAESIVATPPAAPDETLDGALAETVGTLHEGERIFSLDEARQVGHSALSATAAIKALIAALELEEPNVRSLDISANGIIRVMGVDRSLRTRRFDGLDRGEPAVTA